MAKMVIMFNTGRDGYSVGQCKDYHGETMTVGELIEFLSDYAEDTEIYYKNDNGYTYGSITEGRIEEEYVDDDDDDEEDDKDWVEAYRSSL